MLRKSLIIRAEVTCSYVAFHELLDIIYAFVAGQFVTQFLAIHPPDLGLIAFLAVEAAVIAQAFAGEPLTPTITRAILCSRSYQNRVAWRRLDCTASVSPSKIRSERIAQVDWAGEPTVEDLRRGAAT
jgi:hypothetical protein